MTENEIKNEYLKINPHATNFEAWAFGGTTPEMPNILANLVLKDIKRATSSAHVVYKIENIDLPKVGAYNIILDSSNEAICIIETTKVYVVPFNQVSNNHAYLEGEGDKSLHYWKTCHKEFFTSEMKSFGLKFSEQMLVVCEEFKRVYPI